MMTNGPAVPRPPGRWISALLLLAGALAVLLVPCQSVGSDRLLGILQDAAHFPFFLLLSVLLARLARGALPAAFAVAVVFLLGAEALQPLVGRSASLRDTLFGLAGVLAAACLVSARRAGPRARRSLVFLTVALVAAAALPPSAVVLDRVRARRELPLLGSFERWLELGRWTVGGSRADRMAAHATAGRYALCLQVTNDAPYPGLFLTDGPPDWRGYRRLCADVFLEGAAGRALWVRIDDRPGAAYAERFQAECDLAPGTNAVCVSLDNLRSDSGRPMDLGRVVSAGFFLDRAAVGDRLWLDHVRLTP